MPRLGDAVVIYCGGKKSLTIYTRFGWRCQCCGEPFVPVKS